MSNPNTVSRLPKVICRRFSTGSMQYIKQSDASVGTNLWNKWAKGALLCLSVGGLGFSAFSTRNLYDSKSVKCKAYWNEEKF